LNKISCSTKRKLYLTCRQHPNKETKRHYQLYSKILANVIREAKKSYYNKKILKSTNKSKTTWNLIKQISGHKQQNINVQDLKLEHKHVTDPKEIASIFNDNFFLKILKATRMRQKTDKKIQYSKIIIPI
jgi:hypothetical protein